MIRSITKPERSFRPHGVTRLDSRRDQRTVRDDSVHVGRRDRRERGSRQSHALGVRAVSVGRVGTRQHFSDNTGRVAAHDLERDRVFAGGSDGGRADSNAAANTEGFVHGGFAQLGVTAVPAAGHDARVNGIAVEVIVDNLGQCHEWLLEKDGNDEGGTTRELNLRHSIVKNYSITRSMDHCF
jgi:hypothetical protein